MYSLEEQQYAVVDKLKKSSHSSLSNTTGVGRTGTYIAVDIALEQASRAGVVDIAGIINRLREQRMKMVQTAVSHDIKNCP